MPQKTRDQNQHIAVEYFLASQPCVKEFSPPFYRKDETGNVGHLTMGVQMSWTEKREPSVPAGYQPGRDIPSLIWWERAGVEVQSGKRMHSLQLLFGFRIYVTQQLKFFPVLLHSLAPLQRSKENHGHTAYFNHPQWLMLVLLAFHLFRWLIKFCYPFLTPCPSISQI